MVWWRDYLLAVFRLVHVVLGWGAFCHGRFRVLLVDKCSIQPTMSTSAGRKLHAK
jgi:hypothetical protein